MEDIPPHIDAIFKEYIGSRNLAIADLQVYARAPVGVGEHPDIGEMVKQKLAEVDKYESLLQTIMNLYPSLNNQKQPQPESSVKEPSESIGEPTPLYEDAKVMTKFGNGAQNSENPED